MADARWRQAVSLLIAMGTVAGSGDAAAQSSDQKAAAEMLFNDARRAMDAGQYTGACAKLEQSQDIDPSVGTLGWLARCYEKLGKTATAWATYRSASSFAQQRGDTGRKALADERASALEPVLSRLELDTSAVAQLAGIAIARNGEPVARALWDAPFPVDPGEHRFEVSAPGYGTASLAVSVSAAGSQQTIRIPALVRTPDLADAENAKATPSSIDAGKPTSAPPPPPAAPVSVSSGVRDAGSGMSAQAIAGLTAGGLGVAGLTVGAIFLVKRNSSLEARDSSCPAAPRGDCPSESKRLEYEAHQEDAKGSATTSSVAFIAGAALIGAGAVLWLTAPRSSSKTNDRASAAALYPVLQRDGGSVWLSTKW